MYTPEWYNQFAKDSCVLACDNPKMGTSCYCKKHHEEKVLR